MTDFKVGDKVKCINPNRHLKNNKIYEILVIDEDELLSVMDDDTQDMIQSFHYPHRFQLISNENNIDHLSILKGY